MIDLHSHVLPGVDDGAPDLEESVTMARVATLAGTRVLVATPHVRADFPGVRTGEVAERVARLRDALRERDVALDVRPGGEVGLADALERDLAELRRVTLGANGHDLLVETPHGPLPGDFEDRVAAVAARGFRVLLAHPERSGELQRAPERLGALAGAGVLVQLTAAAFRAGPRAPGGTLARLAVREGWAHAIASDGHRADRRPPSLAEGLEAARQSMPDLADALGWMVQDAPRAILAGEPLPPRPPRVADGPSPAGPGRRR